MHYINARSAKDKGFMPFYLLFVIYPLLELWVFVEVTGEIGFLMSLCLLVLAGVIGSALVRYQGFQTILAMHDSVDRGKIPLGQMFDGFCIVGAGILLIAPGFLSDILGIMLLLPYGRGLLKSYFKRSPRWQTTDTGVIVGEYERIEEEPKAITQDKP
jgi:UPF0716 protein FxsA